MENRIIYAIGELQRNNELAIIAETEVSYIIKDNYKEFCIDKTRVSNSATDGDVFTLDKNIAIKKQILLIAQQERKLEYMRKQLSNLTHE